MKKKILISLGVAMMASSVVLASPINDYSKGSLNVDVSMSISPEYDINGYIIDGKDKLGIGATYGLGTNWAVGAKYNSFTLKGSDSKVDFYTINALYKINDNFSAIVGYDKQNYDVANTSGIHVGILGQTQLADKLKGWASLTTGSHLHGYEVGLGYELQNNLDFNVSYNETTYKKVDFDSGYYPEHKIKGVNAGLTFKL